MYVTVNELLGVPGVPNTAAGIRYNLAKCVGDHPYMARRRQGSKAIEYHVDCLPPETRQALVDRRAQQLLLADKAKAATGVVELKTRIQPRVELEQLKEHPEMVVQEASGLTDKQKQIASARCLLCQEVDKLREFAGMGRNAAVAVIADGSKDGSLPERVANACRIANARKGKRSGLSRSSLQEWYSIYLLTVTDTEKRLVMLAPGHHKETPPEDISWLLAFLAHWRDPNGPTMAYCYRKFAKEWDEVYHDQPAMQAVKPSYDVVRRVMNKLPRRERMRGRVSGAVARSLETYSRRDWSQMPVNGCWICDGKSLNMKVRHPVSRSPFTPELTLIIDGRSRFVVGFSLSYSENQRGVSEAYRYAIAKYGKPLFVYTDNGPGQKNKRFDADITGIFPRAGITHMTGIPGNPQARGIIERLNGVIPYRLAQRFATYNGRGADQDRLKLFSRVLDSADNAAKQFKPLDKRQRAVLDQVPEWDDVIQAIQEEVDDYNEHHEHSALPKFQGKYLSPAVYREAVLAVEGDEIEYLTEIELREMFMPEEIRTVDRGYIELRTNIYFAGALINYDGEKVRVAYDTRNAEEIIIRKMDGVFICKAIWNGNVSVAVPVSDMDRAQEERRQRAHKRVSKKAREIEAQANPALEHKPDFNFGFLSQQMEQQKAEHDNADDGYDFFESEREQKLKKNGTYNH
ncbi:transposase [Salmonella enterica subsp. enterica serovar Java]|nr:transposase [Salmonella enterica subsp. enterica serovar Java]ECB7403989.1 transposase [Salmonella enterica subsp. enterica serovar Java]